MEYFSVLDAEKVDSLDGGQVGVGAGELVPPVVGHVTVQHHVTES